MSVQLIANLQEAIKVARNHARKGTIMWLVGAGVTGVSLFLFTSFYNLSLLGFTVAGICLSIWGGLIQRQGNAIKNSLTQELNALSVTVKDV